MKSESKLPVRNYVGYAMGDMAGVLTFGTIGALLQMFYTDILHISLASITVLMMVARIWDAVNDPMCGALIDSRKPTKYGRFRPYVLYFPCRWHWPSLPHSTRCPGFRKRAI